MVVFPIAMESEKHRTDKKKNDMVRDRVKYKGKGWKDFSKRKKS